MIRKKNLQQQYIFIVGKAPASPRLLEQIRAQGYHVGLLADSSFVIKGPERYDKIISFDFSRVSESLLTLSMEKDQVAGLYCDYENYILPAAHIAEQWHLPALSVESATICTDKYLMRQAFHRFDPALSPAFERIDNPEAAVAFANRHGYPVIVKPTNLVKSLLIKKCNTEAELRKHVEYVAQHIEDIYASYQIYDRSPHVIIEQYITGTSYSTAAYVDQQGRAHFCEGIVAIKTAQDIGVDDTYLYSRTLPVALPTAVSEAIFNTSHRAIKALGMATSPAHVELILADNSEIKVVEIGARTGGYRPDMYAAAYGLNLYEQEIKLITGKPLDLRSEVKCHTAVYELFPDREGTFVGIEGPKLTSAVTMVVKAQPGSQVGQARNGFRAAAFVRVTAVEAAEFSHSCQLVEKLRVRTA